MSKRAEEYHKEFDALYGDHEPNLSLSKVELAASEAAYGWQSDKEGCLTLEMFPEVFKRGFLNGYEQAEKDLAEFISTVQKMRHAQAEFRRTRIAGWDYEAQRQEKIVDDMIKNMLEDESRH